MNPIAPYMKAAVMVVMAAAGVATAALIDGHIDSVEWLNIILSVVGAVAVYVAPNVPGAGAAYTKLLVAALIAAGTVAANFVLANTHLQDITVSQWAQMGLAALGALSVYLVPNSPTPAVARPVPPPVSPAPPG